ncbi:MAG: DUF262 domain-containing protein [bacterium]|nr:DUF262 domain-containing protein [bacterium]
MERDILQRGYEVKANETKLIRIIEGTNQYLVPHFQRPYTWQRKNWDTLWADVEALLGGEAPSETPREHFMGAIVTAPAHSVPEGVTKYLLIDGQQRLTTLLTMLAAIRDRARLLDDQKLANRIHELYLTNRYQDGLDQYKLLPTQGNEPQHNDRSAFMRIVDAEEQAHPGSALHTAYQHFARLLKPTTVERVNALANAVLAHVLLVSIVLERDDNPYAIFESLNAKGQPLSQSDLVRNFFFMSIDSSRHDHIYSTKWTPMERAIGRENMETYIRHFLIRRGTVVKEADVYFALKTEVEDRGREHAEPMLDELVKFSQHYVKFIDASREHSTDIRERLVRLQRLRATVCYPFLLNVFEDRASGKMTDREAIDILDVIENFVVRRYVCGTIRAELNEVFTALYRNASRFTRLGEGVREVLGSRNYPLDEEFFENLQTRKLYAVGEARDRARLILERLEECRAGKERVGTDNLTIEHIMPQTLTDWWREHLGPSVDETYELYLHTIGNLTLTAYNAELSNADFPKKAELLRESRLTLNSELPELSRWTREEIELRAKSLAERALEVWPNFAPHASARRHRAVRGTTPKRVVVLGEAFEVKSWQDVLRVTLTQLMLLGTEVIDQLLVEFPKNIRRSGTGLTAPKALSSELYYEGHLNAEQIYRLCSQIVQQVGLSSGEWHVDNE